MQRGFRPGFWYRKGHGEDGRILDDYSRRSRWDATRVGLDESCDRLDVIGEKVEVLCRERELAGAVVEDKYYMGFGSDAYTKYAMMRLLWDCYVEEYGQFAVLHVSYDRHDNTGMHRFAWTNQHLFSENATGFILLNEGHMMSMRRTNNQVVIRDTNLDARLDGFWGFLHRTGIFGGSKIVLDEETPQQGMGHGGCVVMSFVNTLLPDHCYATADDAEVMKLPYIEKIFDMIVRGNCSPYDLAPNDWRHESLGLIERGPAERDDEYVTSYDETGYDEEEARETEAWSKFARFRLKRWLSGCMCEFSNYVTRNIIRLYFQEMYDACVEAAPNGADLDDMRLYADLWARMNLVDRATTQAKAELCQEEYEERHTSNIQGSLVAEGDDEDDEEYEERHTSNIQGSLVAEGDDEDDEEYEERHTSNIQDSLVAEGDDEDDDFDEDNWSEEFKLAWEDIVIKYNIIPGSRMYHLCKKTLSDAHHKEVRAVPIQPIRIADRDDDKPKTYWAAWEKESRTHALSHYCTRIYKLPVKSRLHFTMILGDAWTRELENEMRVHPYQVGSGRVPWDTVDSLGIDDEIYHRLDDELVAFESMLWPVGGRRPMWKWNGRGFPEEVDCVD
ncbi:hypothetical protein T484DRAFT_1755049 [Baffinella frigidus]|nr:hypothetical protein T484DRAFT_1755049 [Cryptophyta sp. CCMP2293]